MCRVLWTFVSIETHQSSIIYKIRHFQHFLSNLNEKSARPRICIVLINGVMKCQYVIWFNEVHHGQLNRLLGTITQWFNQYNSVVQPSRTQRIRKSITFTRLKRGWCNSLNVTVLWIDIELEFAAIAFMSSPQKRRKKLVSIHFCGETC